MGVCVGGVWDGEGGCVREVLMFELLGMVFRKRERVVFRYE